MKRCISEHLFEDVSLTAFKNNNNNSLPLSRSLLRCLENVDFDMNIE